MSFTPVHPRTYMRSSIGSHDSLFAVPSTTAGASSAYPAANLALYVPIIVTSTVTAYETWVETGTLTTSNGTEIGLYDTAGNRLFTTATTVASASTLVNSSGMTDYVISPGQYYLAFGCDGTRNFLATTLAAGSYQAIGCMEQTGLTGANLPTTWTAAVYTRAYLPLFGLNLRSSAL